MSPENSFDSVAPFYPALERMVFGDRLDWTRSLCLGPVVENRHVLLIGEGNGRFLAECLKRKRGGSIVVIDSSPKMLSLLRERIHPVGPGTKLDLVCTDFRHWNARRSVFDVAVTQFLLDLFEEDQQEKIVQRLNQCTSGIWVNVDFCPDAMAWNHRLLMWAQYRFFRLTSRVTAQRLHDWRPLCPLNGWVPEQERLLLGGLVLLQILRRTT